MVNTYAFALRVFFLIFVSLSSASSQDQPIGSRTKLELTLDAKPTKLVYLNGETVEFNFTLRNVSKEEQIVARQLKLTLNVDLRISDSQGRQVKWCGRIADQIIPSKHRYIALLPGKSLPARLAVSCANKDDPGNAWGYLLDAPGKYTVKAAYRLPQPKEYFESLFPNAHVVRGPVVAEPVTIELK